MQSGQPPAPVQAVAGLWPKGLFCAIKFWVLIVIIPDLRILAHSHSCPSHLQFGLLSMLYKWNA